MFAEILEQRLGDEDDRAEVDVEAGIPVIRGDALDAGRLGGAGGVNQAVPMLGKASRVALTAGTMACGLRKSAPMPMRGRRRLRGWRRPRGRRRRR